MKIVFFSSDNNAASGAFRAELNLVKDLEKKGHEVKVVLPYYGDGKKLTQAYQTKVKHILSAPWVYPMKKGFVSNSLKAFARPTNWLASLRMRRFLKRNKTDLVVINTLWTGAGAAAALKCNIPVVWHMREILEVGQNHTLIAPKKSYEIINKSKVCLAVSKYVKKYYKENINPNNVSVIYDGVDKNIFYNPNKQLFKDDKVHFLMLGTVNEFKGQHIGIKALNALSHYNFDLKIVGVCAEDYKKKLLEMCENIKERVSFISATTSPEKYYEQCDVFLMNSIGEAFGLVTAEAMMAGMVVVSSKCGGGEEIIFNSNNGYFYKPLNVEDLSKKIEYILKHKLEAATVARNGQLRAIKYFDKKLNSDRIEKVYLEVIKNTYISMKTKTS